MFQPQNKKTLMSVQTSSTLETINRSALNTSKSKAMYTFTKANRFIELKQPSKSFYEKPSMLNKRATSFGYGHKSQLISRYMDNPSPDKYNKSSQFQVSPKRGISIGLGRDSCKNVSIFNTSKYPAPTDYSYEQKQNSKAFSMRIKVKLPELFPDINTPGPGQYTNQNIQKNGSFFNSKFKSNICFKMNDKSPKKIERVTCPSLGPMTYNTILPSTGKQILSKKKTQKSFYFDKKTRVTMHVDSISPGPGAYKQFSQFNR